MSRMKIAAACALIVGTSGAGWAARGWHEDAQRLSAERAAQKVADAAMSRESAIAKTVEKRLAELQASERIIDRGIIREVQKPVYQRVCLEPDAIRLLNNAAAGTRPDTAKPADALPDNAAGAE